MSDKELKRIYRIEVQGIADATKKVEQLNQEINLQTQIKKEAQKILLTNPGDVAQIEKQSKAIAESEVAIKKLSAEKRIAIREAEALIKAQERARSVELAVANASVQAAGSYKQLYAESKRLNDLYRSTAPTDPLFEKIKADAIEAQRLVHDFNRTLSSEGTLVGEYSRGIINAFNTADMGDILKNQVKRGEDELAKLNASLDELKLKYHAAAAAGTTGLQDIERELIENRRAALQLETQVGTMRTELANVGTVGGSVTQELKNGFKGLSSDLINTAIAFVGVQAAMDQIPVLVQNMKELSDQTTGLEIELGKSAGGAQKLVDGLAAIDTRTTLAELENIANIAAKAGVSETNLVGVATAIDKVKVAFGKDFGDVEKGTEDIIKLIGIFEGTDRVDEDSILKTGNAIRVLANESTASVPYLNEMSGRVAGLKQTFAFTLPDVLGLASGFEQFKVSSEIAGTALNTIIPKLAGDVEGFAKIAGVTKEQFSQLINTNPAEAFIKVSEALVQTKGGVEQFSKAFKDSELGAGRISNVIAVAGGKAAEFRKAILSAGTAYQDTSNIERAFAARNENFAGVLDKISKKFTDLGNNKTLQSVIFGVASAVAFLLGNLQVAIPLFTILIGLTNTAVGAKLRLVGAFLLERSARAVEIIQLAVTNGLKATATFLTNAYTTATIASATATGAAAVAYRVLAGAIALISSPIGLIIGLTVALTTVFGIFSASAATTRKELQKLSETSEQYAARLRVEKELSEKVAAATSSQVANIKLYTKIASDASISDKTRLEALNKLIAIDPAYRAALKGQTIDTAALTAQSDKLVESLIKQARAQATAELLKEKSKEIITLEAQISGSYEDDGQGGKKVVNKNTSLFGAVGSLFSDNETDKLDKAETKLRQTKADVENLMNRIKGDKDLQASLTKTEDSETGLSTSTASAAGKAKQTAEQIRDARLAVIKGEEELMKNLNEIKFRKNEIDEIAYLNNMNSIVQKYSDLKLAVVLQAAAQEKQKISEFQLDKISSEKDTNEKVYKLRSEALKLELIEFKEDSKKTALENAQARVDIDIANREAVIKYNLDSLLLENEFHITSIENEKKWAKELSDIDEKLNEDLIELDDARLQDVKDKGETELSKFKADIAQKRLKLIEEGKSTKQFDLEEKVGTLSRELQTLNEEYPLIKAQYEKGQIAAKEYYDFLEEYDNKAAELHIATTAVVQKTFEERVQGYKSLKDLISGELKNLLNPNNEPGLEYISEAAVQAFDLAKSAMNSYFDGKQKRIEQDKKQELDKLEQEKQNQLARAQSAAEERSIEKQAALAKIEIEKKAFEEAKKQKKAQAKISLAVELANIAVQAAANPNNAATFGAAGLIQFAVLGALAGARYALRVGEINKEKYASGGVVSNGGQFRGPSHAQGGIPIEVEGDELAIINKRSANSGQRYNVSGTAKQIASAINEAGGGVGFATGGRINKLEYGGSFGRKIAVPSDLSYLKDGGALELIAAINNRIDNIKVINVARETELVNNNYKKATQINTL